LKKRRLKNSQKREEIEGSDTSLLFQKKAKLAIDANPLEESRLGFKIESHDESWTNFHTGITMGTGYYKKPESGWAKNRELNNWYSLIAEKAFMEVLRKEGILYFYSSREADHWEKERDEPFDFWIATEKGTTITVEVKAVPPKSDLVRIPERHYTNPPDYLVAVKLTESEIVGYPRVTQGEIAGYLTREDIKELPITSGNGTPCPYEPCKVKPLDELRPIKELFKIIFREALRLNT